MVVLGGIVGGILGFVLSMLLTEVWWHTGSGYGWLGAIISVILTALGAFLGAALVHRLRHEPIV
jgi:hypothetical protein